MTVMNNSLLKLIVIGFLFSGCGNNKNYKYIEVDQESNVLSGTEVKEHDPITIRAATDSAAYLDAYERFCIGVKVDRDMVKSFGKSSSAPLRFKLLNESGTDVSTITFSSKQAKQKEIESRIFSLENNIKAAIDSNKIHYVGTLTGNAQTDSGKIKELSKYFRTKKDEFSNDNKVWYEPKSAPSYVNSNGIYCYFETENGRATNLRFRIQYYADDWLFFRTVQFSIDGNAYEYIPLNTETDNGDGYIWEWSDEHLSADDRQLIYALANGTSAKMKLIGRQYYKVKTITKQQITSIKQTLDFYKAWGGEY